MKIVIALGGNALGENSTEQEENIIKVINNIIPLIKDGNQIIITHGNGPQVGMIYNAFDEMSRKNKNFKINLPECTAMSQGYIGYHIQKNLRNKLKDEGIDKKVISIITEVLVDENDESILNPSKPIGEFHTKEEAIKLMNLTGDKYINDSNRGYRKVVPSPKPIDIINIETLNDLIRNDNIVIFGGGGGIPISNISVNKSINGVVDKDLVSALIAEKSKSDVLIILTSVQKALINYGKKNEKAIEDISITEIEKLLLEGHFAKGSMLPKIEASINFVKNTNKPAIITSIDNLDNAVNFKESTIIHV